MFGIEHGSVVQANKTSSRAAYGGGAAGDETSGMLNDFNQEGGGGNGSKLGWDTILKDRNKMMRDMLEDVSEIDLLNIEEIKSNQLKDLRQLSEIIKYVKTEKAGGFDKMGSMEQNKTTQMMRSAFTGWTTNSGKNTGAEIMFMTGEAERGEALLHFAVQVLITALKKWKKESSLKESKETKNDDVPQTPKSGPKSEDEEESGNEDYIGKSSAPKPGPSEEEIQYMELMEELATLRVILGSNNTMGLLLKEDVLEKINRFKSVEYTRCMMGRSNEKIHSLLMSLCTTYDIQRSLVESINVPVVGNKHSVEGALGYPTSVIKVMSQIFMKAPHVTRETYQAWENELRKFQLDYTRLGDGGFGRQIEEFNEMKDKLGMVLQELKNGDEYDTSLGIESGTPHAWILLTRTLEQITEHENSSTKCKNFELVKSDIKDLNREADKKQGPLDERTRWLCTMLKNIDARHGKRLTAGAKSGKKDEVEAPWGLLVGDQRRQKTNGGVPWSASAGAGKPQGKGKGKGKGKGRFCGNVLRNGFCDEEGCQKVPVPKSWMESRGDCYDDKGKGGCRFGNGCKFKHHGDPTTLTEAMTGKCNHHNAGPTVNAAEYAADSSSEEDGTNQ